MNKVIKRVAKIAAVGGALAAALTGCCMFGSDKGCCDKSCGSCCKTSCCGETGCGQKSHGVNASTSVGIGTDGVRVGGEANVGGHGVSGSVGGAMR